MQRKKSKKLPLTPEEEDLKAAIKALQHQKRALRRQIDDIDTEMIGYKERLLFLREQREKKARTKP